MGARHAPRRLSRCAGCPFADEPTDCSVVAVGAVACGTETVDDVEPATPAQVKVQPESVDLAKERYEALKRHYLPPADSHKAAERYIEKEQQYSTPPVDSHKAAERTIDNEQDSGRRHMSRPGPGF